jgi:glycopeptide antibiotics resistance protein
MLIGDGAMYIYRWDGINKYCMWVNMLQSVVGWQFTTIFDVALNMLQGLLVMIYIIMFVSNEDTTLDMVNTMSNNQHASSCHQL